MAEEKAGVGGFFGDLWNNARGVFSEYIDYERTKDLLDYQFQLTQNERNQALSQAPVMPSATNVPPQYLWIGGGVLALVLVVVLLKK